MTQHFYDTALRSGTSAFIHHVCETIKDMANVHFTPGAEKQVKPTSSAENGIVLIAPFFGMVQGEFLLSTTEFIASSIAGKYTPGAPAAAIAVHRDTYTGLLSEVLNVSAHRSISEVEKTFGKLHLQPPAWVYGEYHTVDYISGIGTIKGIHGVIHCSLVLNMAYTPAEFTSAQVRQ